MGFRENIKLLLESNGLKQADLCRITGIQTSLMSEYLAGKKSPTIRNAILISDALNVTLDALVGKEAALIQTDRKEKEFLGIYKRLPPVLQDYIIKSAEDLLQALTYLNNQDA